MLQSEMYTRVAHQLDIPIHKVIEYDRQMWSYVRNSLNSPEADVIELPFLGSFSITKVKMGRTLRRSVILLKKIKKRLNARPDDTKLRIKYNYQIELFKKLWKLKQECRL
jgi:hypothetical protein